MAFSGSCHCGKLAFTVDEEMPTKGLTCNCSICRRKGNIHHFTTPDKFAFEGSPDDATIYTFNTHTVRYRHCNTCGCAPFAEGKGPNGAMVGINLRCVPDCDLEALEMTEYDGASG